MRSLPPRVAQVQGGKVTWERLQDVDYELLGYFLSCHLIVEHYLDQTLKAFHPGLDWNAAKQTFGQKIALLTKLQLPTEHDSIPAIKHLNSLRNRLSHRVDFKLHDEDLLPLVQYLQKSAKSGYPVPSDPKDIIEEFTTRVCAFFGGAVYASVQHGNQTRDEV